MQEALQLLRGLTLAPAELAPIVARVRASLAGVELEALEERPLLPFDAAPLRQALGTRLRLALALERAPRLTGEADRSPLNALLAQVDGVLEALRPSQEQAPPEALKRIEATRNALVRDAVALSEVVSPPAAQAPRPAAPRKGAASTGKVVLLSQKDVEAQGASRRRNLLAVGAAVVVAVAAAAFQLWSARTEFTPPPTVPGAPPGIGVTQSPSGQMLVRTFDGKPPSPEVGAWLETQRQKGFRQRTLGPGLLVLEPPRAPSAPGAVSP